MTAVLTAWKAVATIIAVCCLATDLFPVAIVMAASVRKLNNCRPPSIQKQGPGKGYFIQNAKVSIPCIAQGDGKITYQWLKDGEPIDMTREESKHRMTTEYGIGSLVIYKARAKDEGDYQCVVTNNCGTSLSSITTMLHATMAPFPRVDKPSTIKGVLGSSAILTCNPPHSVPKATIAWILIDAAGGPLTFDEDNDEDGVGFNTVTLDRRVTMDYDGNLYITSLRKQDKQDDKIYVCLAQNKLTRSSNKGDDKVIVTRGNEVVEMGVDLMWNSQPKNLVLQGKKAKFKCIFSGQPEPEIKWTRVTGGQWDDTRMNDDHHELVIREVQFGDAGTYMCSGSNSLNPQPKTMTFTLEVEASPQWRVTPRDVEAGVGESASFECEAVGNPKPSVQWFVNGKPYSNDSSKGVLNGNTMVFENLEKEESQVIQCNASNIYGFIWADVYLFVQALPPVFLTEPKEELIVVRDYNATLTCHVTGKPKPKVVWYKGSQPLNHHRFIIQDTGNLLIVETTMRDKGRYICKAENRYGKAEASGSLTVRDKTKIVTEPVGEKVVYTNQVTFTCGATTDDFEMTNLRYRWLKDDAPLNVSDKRVEVNGGVITISDTQPKDSGDYTCVAENGLDNATSTAKLEVKAPPEAPYGLVVSECLAKGATLQWTFDEEKMGNFGQMVGFIVELQTDYDTTSWTKAVDVDHRIRETHVSLSPFANYRFRIKAVNKMGVGEPSTLAPTECETLPAAPDKNPEDVKTDEQFTGYLVIRWKPMELIELNGGQFQYNIKIQDLETSEEKTFNITDHTQGVFKMPVDNVYRPYIIRMRARNQIDKCILPPKRVTGYSGESVPKVIPQNFEVDPDLNITATMAGFMWDPVDTSVDKIQGKFEGYKIRFWKKGEKETSMHEEVIFVSEEDNLRRKRDAGADGKMRARVVNLPSFSEIVADVVVINKNFESGGSNKVNLTTPEGVPGPVRFLEAVNRGSNHIKVYWEKPVHPNGILTGYQLSYRKIDKLDFEDFVIVDEDFAPEENRYTIAGLDLDSQYRIYIRARTNIGLGQDFFIDVATSSEIIGAVTRASFLSAAWFIGMMIAIAILILILIIVCIIKRNRGDNYPVQEKERLRGSCDDNKDNFNEIGKGSDDNGNGGNSSSDRDGEKVPLDANSDSMDSYGDDNASKFNEDGSFIGQYGTGGRKGNDVANASASSVV